MRLPKAPPAPELLLDFLGSSASTFVELGSPTLPDGRYLHWDELRHRKPPAGLSREQWWATMRVPRRLMAVRVKPMEEVFESSFSFVETPVVRSALHRFDRENISKILANVLGDEDAVTEYRVRLLVEEAIGSSVIEGARPTTRELARQMVHEQREPASKDERMILNNWRAMQRIVELHKEGESLCLDGLLELHHLIGEDALDVAQAAGQLRGADHEVRVEDEQGTVWHVPPPALDPQGGLPPLRQRVEAMLEFANASSDDGPHFIHPLLRAIVSHFWLAYEHPFRDGNGRMARALFYWVMLRHGYEMAEFLSISGPIDRKPSAYYRAFAYVESDAGDLTYFILHQLAVLQEALDALLGELEERKMQAETMAQAVAGFDQLNYRQRALLHKSVQAPLESYTIEGHASAHGVHYLTARSDLQKLENLGYLVAERVGKRKRFRPSAMLSGLVRKSRTSRR